jgi:hypothetical protein
LEPTKKGFSQIKDIENSYLALDDMERGFGKKIPLLETGRFAIASSSSHAGKISRNEGAIR